MTIPILNTPNQEADARLQLVADAKRAAEVWARVMREQRAKHCVFGFRAPMSIPGGVAFGLRVEELERLGFSVVSHSSTILDQSADGVFLMFYTLHVRAPEVMIATR
jgi:hypothetical protein